MIKARFYSTADDVRPIYSGQLPNGPWWVSGYAEEGTVIVAYAKDVETILQQWPEASNIQHEYADKITFSDRFPRPKYWPEGLEQCL